jgi:spore coat polysaccharide biosynthesis predicted glycosyltransferase SpsG
MPKLLPFINLRSKLIEAKTFWFGCQSNSKVGLGHVSRCVALAEEIEERGHFSCFAHVSNLDTRGQQLLYLSGLRSECNCNSKPDVVIYDSYDLDFIQSNHASGKTKVILLVDDISMPLSVDAYLEASTIKNWKPLNSKASVFKFDCNPILRTVFDKPLHSLNFSPPFDVIVNLGAARDFQLILEELIPQIRSRSDFNCRVTILTGSNSVLDIVDTNGTTDLNLIEGTYNLRGLITPHSFVISAAGVTAWELISLGVPGFLIGVVDNQVEQLGYFNKLGLRNGVNFQHNPDFSTQLNHLLDGMNFVETAKKAQTGLRNGRVESVNWILGEVLNLPSHLA